MHLVASPGAGVDIIVSWATSSRDLQFVRFGQDIRACTDRLFARARGVAANAIQANSIV